MQVHYKRGLTFFITGLLILLVLNWILGRGESFVSMVLFAGFLSVLASLLPERSSAGTK